MKRSRLRPGKKPLARSEMKRGKAELKRRVAVKRRNKRRREREWARAYGSRARVEWVKGLTDDWPGSVVSGERFCENAHVPPGGDLSGMSRKPDAKWIVPLTEAEHKELHRVGRATFEARHEGIDLATEAERIDREWKMRSEA